ncbi:MAG: hypothetical protein PHD17_11295 [Methanothrix soehngenii]|nr:hypothetical protein [Candidatus Methanomethylophilaceae archaeon]MDD3975255.1 hypothetical protein [Methanothrix soehngenii]
MVANYVEVQIDMTAKPAGRSEAGGGYTLFHQEKKTFRSMAEVQKWLKDRYGSSRRQPMYADKKDGSTEKVGYVISFKDQEYEGGRYRTYYHQDWIGIREIPAASPFTKKAPVRRR